MIVIMPFPIFSMIVTVILFMVLMIMSVMSLLFLFVIMTVIFAMFFCSMIVLCLWINVQLVDLKKAQ